MYTELDLKKDRHHKSGPSAIHTVTPALLSEITSMNILSDSINSMPEMYPLANFGDPYREQRNTGD